MIENEYQTCKSCNENGIPVIPPTQVENCPTATQCSEITFTDCIKNSSLSDTLCGSDVVYSPTDNQTQINKKIVDYFCARIGGALYKEVTRAQAIVLVEDNSLVTGALYKITDSGVYLVAISNTLFSSEGLREMRIVRGDMYVPFITGTNKGVWTTLSSIVLGDKAVHGGKVWQNLTGSLGTAVDMTSLDTVNWQIIPTTDNNYYQTKYFEISYDFTNDWVYFQKDDQGNEITCSRSHALLTGEIENRIEYTDWGNTLIWYNKCRGIINNGDLVAGNMLGIGDIIGNKGGVTNNRNSGVIRNNTASGGVFNNTNSGDILGNTNATNISSNANVGAILNNSNNGIISHNVNNGDILGLGATVTDVEYNKNNGTITTTVVGPITDPVVNK